MSSPNYAHINDINALLGEGASFNGTLLIHGVTYIDGTVVGNVYGAGILVVGPHACIRGPVKLDSLIMLGGHIWGDVHAADVIELHAASEIHGNVHTQQLFRDNNALIEGECLAEQSHELSAGRLIAKGELLEQALSETVS